MLVHKCDKCKKEVIDSEKRISVIVGLWTSNVLLCDSCGKPVVSFLKKNKLVNSDKVKIRIKS